MLRFFAADFDAATSLRYFFLFAMPDAADIFAADDDAFRR